MTSDNNLIYFDEVEQTIGIWSMEGKKPIIAVDAKNSPAKIYATASNKRYFIAY